MAFLFNKFQESVKVLAKFPTFARDPRHVQFESDINRLFLYTSHHRLGKEADEKDAEEIIDMASNAPLNDQQKQVQENVHSQIETFCTCMCEILLPDLKSRDEPQSLSETINPPRRGGLSLAVGGSSPLNNCSAVPETKGLKRAEVSQRLRELIGYTLEIKPSQIPHEDAGLGLFLNGEADPGAVIAFYPGVIYSPAYYRYIPGYPRVDAQNSYLITRYDGAVINAKPWGAGGESREMWDGSQTTPPPVKAQNGSDRIWAMLSKPLDGTSGGGGHKGGQVLERRNPLAFGHFANHPAKDTTPNVMICPYDFTLSGDHEGLRPYIPNVSFGNGEEVRMKKLGSFWFNTWKSSGTGEDTVPVLKSLVLVATRPICDQEEVLLNYRLSNSKRRPAWYVPVDEEEDLRRWS
ncbi:hypothetical protein DM860_012186 [Cuscuta australis]|uniref:SET domain-containing protein n=1 Tax=Cuscuta australis TaxID=267555 RepID=A0A328EAM4_9ASTE|nr:hypothetical protein DM860_012186 [Cuscuta australis]